VPGSARIAHPLPGPPQQYEGVLGALLMQQFHCQIEAGANIAGFPRQRLAQHRFGGFRFASNPQDRTEIGGGGMTWHAAQRMAHRRFGVLGGALAVARDAVIDPGVGPAQRQPDSFCEGAFGVGVLAERRPGLAIRIMRLRPVRRRMTGVARGLQCSQRVLPL
jgi:hypothetical protein